MASVVPGGDVGVAVILLTLIVKFILYPLSKKSTESAIKMKAVQADMDEIKNKYKEDKQEQAKKMMALYKEKGLNPFSGIVLLFIQLPIIMALYYIILKGGLPMANPDLLYSFIPVPNNLSMHFLGLFDVSTKSIIMALIVGVTQFIQIRYSMPTVPAKSDKPSFKDDLARSMSLQMKYGMPVFVAFIAYTLPSVVGLYWITNNIFTIIQEMVVRKNIPWHTKKYE